jgi:hypothetical protein
MTPEEYRINQLEERIDQLESRFHRVVRTTYNILLLGLAVLVAFVLASQRAGVETWLFALGALNVFYLAPLLFIFAGRRRTSMKYSQEFIASTFELNKQK